MGSILTAVKPVFKSFKHRNYRLFFTGQLISVIGTWLQMTAMPWLVYRLTGSALLLGPTGVATAFLLRNTLAEVPRA